MCRIERKEDIDNGDEEKERNRERARNEEREQSRQIEIGQKGDGERW